MKNKSLTSEQRMEIKNLIKFNPFLKQYIEELVEDRNKWDKYTDKRGAYEEGFNKGAEELEARDKKIEELETYIKVTDRYRKSEYEHIIKTMEIYKCNSTDARTIIRQQREFVLKKLN